jgi:endonuclease/exonuclease/phosphatase family metal-dependent hydrolase
MRIVSWNMADRPPGDQSRWETLRGLGADLALVQEAVPGPHHRAVYRPSGIAGRDGKARPWGSAVVALTDEVSVTPVGLAEGWWQGRSLGLAPLDCVSRGHVAIARVQARERSFTAISAYGLMEFGYASGTLLRTLADLEPLLDDPELGDSVILAGDWNIGTWWSGRDAKYAQREGAILDLLAAYGFVDCLYRDLPVGRGRLPECGCDLGDGCRHVWTFKKAGSERAYMDDYLFASGPIAEQLRNARVTPDWGWQAGGSDHAPLIADLDA